MSPSYGGKPGGDHIRNPLRIKAFHLDNEIGRFVRASTRIEQSVQFGPRIGAQQQGTGRCRSPHPLEGGGGRKPKVDELRGRPQQRNGVRVRHPPTTGREYHVSKVSYLLRQRMFELAKNG